MADAGKRPSMRAKKICPLATRIKKLMQADEDVGKISQATPVVIGASSGHALCALCVHAACAQVVTAALAPALHPHPPRAGPALELQQLCPCAWRLQADLWSFSCRNCAPGPLPWRRAGTQSS